MTTSYVLGLGGGLEGEGAEEHLKTLLSTANAFDRVLRNEAPPHCPSMAEYTTMHTRTHTCTHKHSHRLKYRQQ